MSNKTIASKMNYLFILSELPYPAHLNGVALINYEIIARAPDNVNVDILVAQPINPLLEAAFRAVAPKIGSITYIGSAAARRFRVGNLLSGFIFGRCFFELSGAVNYLKKFGSSCDAIYIAPLMSIIDPGRHPRVFLNAVDSFARLNSSGSNSIHGLINRLKCWLYRGYEKKMLTRFSLVNFVSSEDVKYVKRYGNNLNLSCIPNGVDAAYFRPNDEPSKNRHLLFTGNFQYGPNKEAAHYFIQSILPVIRLHYPECILYLVGRNSGAEFDGYPGVIVTGFVEDIRLYYQKCSIFVCPLLSGAGIKNKVLEAFASGIPVVTTHIGVEGMDGVCEGVHYLVANTPKDFLEKITQLWESPEFSLSIASSSRELVEKKFSWASAAERYFEILKSVSNSSEIK